LKLAKWFLRRSRLKEQEPNGPVSLNWFLPFLFLYQTMTKECYMPNIYAFIRPQKRPPLYLNKSESPTPKYCFLSSLVEIGLVVLEKKTF